MLASRVVVLTALVLVFLSAAVGATGKAAPQTKVPYGWSSPAWSPNGTLAFTGIPLRKASSIGIFVASRTGKHLRRIAVVKLGGFPQPLQNISWAPQGTMIVCDHVFGEVPNKVRIFVADTRRGGMRKIARGGEPAWAPDGKLIAYKGFPGIHLIRPDGRGDRRLTLGAFDRSPSWSPDGRYLVFIRARTRAGGDGVIYLIRKDGTRLRKLTPRVGDNPVWSPDGRQIAFDAFDHETGAGAIYVIKVDGANENRLTTSFRAFWPKWSPNSARLAFQRSVREDQEESDIAVIARDGSGGERFLAHPGNSSGPAWSPGSRWIAYDAFPRGCRGAGIHIVSAASGRSTEITPCRYGG